VRCELRWQQWHEVISRREAFLACSFRGQTARPIGRKQKQLRTCILIQERTRKENPGGKRQSERGGRGEGEKERDQSQSGRSFADNCSMIHQLIGHSNGECSSNAPTKAHSSPSKPIQGRPCEAAKLGREMQSQLVGHLIHLIHLFAVSSTTEKSYSQNSNF